MSSLLINSFVVVFGGAIMAPLVAMGLGHESEPPRVMFCFFILLLGFFSIILLSAREFALSGACWETPSLRKSFLIKNGFQQRNFISGLSILYVGVLIMCFGNESGVEWMGFLPSLLGGGVMLGVGAVYVLHRDRFCVH